MYYQINKTLTQVGKEEIRSAPSGYVAVLTSDEWQREQAVFDMGIELEPDTEEIHSTKAEVNYDSLTGAFAIPDRDDLAGENRMFAFALDEKGIVFIDDSGAATALVENVRRTKKWRVPSLERFLYDFLEQIVSRDRDILEQYDRELDELESAVISEEQEEAASNRVNEIRGDIRDLRIHYEQLLDFTQELEENENNFFSHENLRYFRLYANRIERLRTAAVAISDHALQIRDIYKSHLDIRQNRIMTVLTVVTTIFMPLTLIAGWYGMNFRYMPELDSIWGYPIIIAVSAAIAVGGILFFKKKKWL